MVIFVVIFSFRNWRKGSLRNLPISEKTYRNQHVATDDDQLQSLK